MEALWYTINWGHEPAPNGFRRLVWRRALSDTVHRMVEFRIHIIRGYEEDGAGEYSYRHDAALF
jgi:hypothetical protein